MGKLSRMQPSGLLLLSIIGLCSAAPYSKYGRTCKDIGCLPREVCVMSYESCSFGQRENESCGRYPTCKKNTDQAAAQPAGFPPANSDTNFNAPTTRRTFITTTTTTTRRPLPTLPPYSSNYPSNPSSGGGYTPNRYDDSGFGGSTYFGGGGTTRPTMRLPTMRPTSRPSSGSSSSSFDGFFNGLKNVLSGQIGNLISSALSGRGGTSGMFDTRPVQENKRYGGGLFNDNINTNLDTRQSSYAPQPTYPSYSSINSRSNLPAQNPTPPQYGWRIP